MAAGYLDLAILVARATTAQVGAYSIVLTLVNATTLIVSLPIQGSLIPFMSKILKENGSLEWSFKRGTRYLSLTAIPILFLLASSSQPLIFLVAGARYPQDILPLGIVMFGLILTTFMGLINASLQAYGKNTSMLVALTISIAVEGVFGYWAIPIYGLVGAALARVIQDLIWIGIEVLVLRWVMRIRVDTPTLSRITLASCSFLIIPLHYLVWSNPLGLAMSCAVAVVVFLLSLKLLQPFTPADVQVILRIVPPILNPFVRALRIQSLAKWLTV
jgi:O-antigen/teichoic acid export membrane protein